MHCIPDSLDPHGFSGQWRTYSFPKLKLIKQWRSQDFEPGGHPPVPSSSPPFPLPLPPPSSPFPSSSLFLGYGGVAPQLPMVRGYYPRKNIANFLCDFVHFR
jgi:hypothetical protein